MADIANDLEVEGVSHAQMIRLFEKAAARIQDDVTEIVATPIRKQAATLAYVVIDAEVVENKDADDEDAERASACGHSFAAAWLAAVLLLGASPKNAVASQSYRLSRIAATEVFSSYNSTLDRIAREQLDPKLFMKRWVTFDPCDICKSHDGETVPVDKPFRDGAIPGLEHPRCRCIIEIVEI